MDIYRCAPYSLVFGSVEYTPPMSYFLEEHYYARHKKVKEKNNHKTENHKL